MASPQPTPHANPDYSTLEVNPEYLHANRFVEKTQQQLPEVNREATSDLDYPEVVANKSEGPFVVGEDALPLYRQTCGMRRKYFIGILVAAVIIAAAVVAGIVVGVRKHHKTPSADASNPTPTASRDGEDKMALLSNTNLASANFTDEHDNENYIVVYQLENRAIYMSCFNSSKDEWIVSPVVDGTGSTGLDEVRGGTSLAIDVYYHNSTWRDVHLYWQSPDNAIKSLFRQSIQTDTKSTADDWSNPFSSDRYSAGNGSALTSYGRQCPECVLYTYLFFQDNQDGLYGGVLLHDNADGWTDRNFSDVAKPAINSSLTLVSVPAQNSSDRGLSIFYQAQSGVLTQLVYNGDKTYSTNSLPRGLSDNSTILAFATGMNGTDLGFQVLTTSPDSSNGVQLTYQQDGTWNSDTQVKALEKCVTKSAMALNFAQRLYCVVEATDTKKLQIVEWAWKGDATGSSSTFTSWDEVGTVNTTKK